MLKPKWAVTTKKNFWREAKLLYLTVSYFHPSFPLLSQHTCIWPFWILLGKITGAELFIGAHCYVNFSENVAWAHCPASGPIVQVRILLGLRCKFSPVSFAVVRIWATSSVVLMLLLLNTWTIIIFGLVFLELFPAYFAITGKIYLASCLISQTPKSWKSHPRFLFPLLTVASTSLGLAGAYSEGGPERDSHCGQGEARAEVAKELLLGWTGNKGALECAPRTCAEVLSKESGSVMPPSHRLVQSPTGRKLLYTGAPPILAEKQGLLAQGRTSWWSALLGASLTEKAGSTCRRMWGEEWCKTTNFFLL